MVNNDLFEKRTGITGTQLETAREELQTARSRAEAQKREIQTRRGELEKFRAGQLTRQQLQSLTLERKRVRDIALGRAAGAQVQLVAARKEVTAFEAQISTRAAEVKQIADLRQDFNKANRLALTGDVFARRALDNARQREFFDQFRTQIKGKKELVSFRKSIADFERRNPTEKIVLNPAGTKVTGIESGAFGQSLSIQEFNKRLASIKKQVTGVVKVPADIAIQLKLPQGKIDTPSKIQKFTDDLVSRLTTVTIAGQAAIGQARQLKKDVIDKLISKGLTPQQQRAIIPLGIGKEQITSLLRKLEEKVPTVETIKKIPGVAKVLETPEGPVSPFLPKAFEDEFLVETTPFVKSGKGTSIINIRQKTFFEKIGVPESTDSRALENTLKGLQSDVNFGTITEEQASVKTEKALNKFVVSQSIRNIPTNLAVGFGLATISAFVPGAGLAITGVFGTSAILNRRRIAENVKRFPAATAINIASFTAGGLAGATIGGAVRGSLAKPRLDVKGSQIKSIQRISGTQKTQLLKLAKQNPSVNAEILTLARKGKVTGTFAYDILLRDGRRLKILQFNSLKAADIKRLADGKTVSAATLTPKGDVTLLGFEFVKGRQTGFITAKGVQTIGKGGQTQTLTRAVILRPKNTAVARALTRFGIKKKEALGFEVLEKGIAIKISPQVLKIESQAVIRSPQKLTGSILKRLTKLETKVARGGKLTTKEVGNLISLRDVAIGQKLFTSQEFKAGTFPTFTQARLNTLISKARISLEKQGLGRALELRVTPSGPRLIATQFRSKFGDFAKLERRTRTEKFIGRGITAPIKGKPIVPKKPIVKPTLTRQGLPALKFEIIKKGVTKLTSGTLKQLRRTKKVRTAKLGQKGFQASPLLGKSLPLEQVLVPVPGTAALLAPQLIAVRTPLSLATAGLTTVVALAVTQKQLSGQLVRQQQRLQTLQTLRQATDITPITKQALATTTKTVQVQIIQLKQQLAQVPKLRAALGVPTVKPTIQPTPGVARLIPPKFTTPQSFGAKIVPLGTPIGKQPGYNVTVKQKGKFIRANKVPIVKNKALDLGAFVADKSLSAQFKIRLSKKPAQKPQTASPNNYFRRTQRKFRPFKIRKGQKILTVNNFIEKRKFRLDTPTEVRRIQAAKIIAQQRKKILPRAISPLFGR